MAGKLGCIKRIFRTCSFGKIIKRQLICIVTCFRARRKLPVAPIILSRFNSRFWRSRSTTLSNNYSHTMRTRCTKEASSLASKLDEYIKNVLQLPQEEPLDTEEISFATNETHESCVSSSTNGRKDYFPLEIGNMRNPKNGRRGRAWCPPPNESCLGKREATTPQTNSRSPQGSEQMNSRLLEIHGFFASTPADDSLGSINAQTSVVNKEAGKVYFLVTSPQCELQSVSTQKQPQESSSCMMVDYKVTAVLELDASSFVANPQVQGASELGISDLDDPGILSGYHPIQEGCLTLHDYSDANQAFTEFQTDSSVYFGQQHQEAMGEDPRGTQLLYDGDSLLDHS